MVCFNFKDSLANGKRKSRDVSPTTKKEQSFVVNPFSAKKLKTQESSTTNNTLPKPFVIPSTSKDNRLILSSKNNGKPKKGKATPNENTQRDTLTPYIFNVTIVDETMENNHEWLSKTTILKDDTDLSKDITHFDENMQEFLNSFNNCVIVETKSLIKERSTLINEHNGISDGKKNFKKFKKVSNNILAKMHIMILLFFFSRYNLYIYKRQ